MATNHTISSGDYIRPYRSAYGQEHILSLGESTAQSFVYGDILEQDSKVSTGFHRAAVAVRSNSTITSTSIIGVAAAPASSVTDQTVIFFSATHENTFWARTINGTLASTNVGGFYGLAKDTTNNVTLVDLANAASTSQRVCITGLIDGLGDSGGAVTFKFGRPAGSTVTFGLGY